jgi:hypothetical protein
MSKKKASHILLMFCGILLTIAVIADAQYSYAALRIVVRDSTKIDSITMNLNQDTTLKVQGLRSDNGHWDPVSATWEVSPGLSMVLSAPPPSSANAWIVSPTARGTGWIRVTFGNASATRPDTVFATFAPGGGPCQTWSQMLAPLDKIVAGDTSLLWVIGIDCVDPPVPEVWCDSVTIADALGSGPGQPQPFAIVNGNNVPLGRKFAACFHNGRDTIRIVMFNAPSSPDSLHQITVYWKGLSAQSAPFYVYPSTIRRLEIQRRIDSSSVDSVFLSYPTGYISLASMGYDAFGNKRGIEKANWNTTGTLHSIIQSKNMSMIYYDASMVTGEEEGYIFCSPVSDSTIRDSVKIRIVGPSGVLLWNRTPQAYYLRFITQNFGAYIFPLPADVAHSRLFLSLYSLSGKVVFTTEIFDAEKPVGMKSFVEPGIYIASVRTAERQLVKGRCVFVK